MNGSVHEQEQRLVQAQRLSRPSRRQVLRSGGAAGAAGLATCALAACGGGDDVPEVTTEADGSFRVPAAAVGVGGSAYIAGAHVIVAQPTPGEYLAFDATCPHQGCQVSGTGAQGQLVCPCHHSTFDPATGAVLSGPAPTGLTVLTVSTDGSDLVIRG